MANVKGITPESGIGSIGRKQVQEQKPAERIEREQHAIERIKEDSLQVDQQRKLDAQMIEDARLLLEELPEIRDAKVAEVRSKLAEGFYDNPDVIKAVADKIVNDPAALQKITGEKVRPDKVDEARDRLNSGYYNQEDVLNETARRIIKRDS
ncbi:MAG: flagellar biosynthesis anti-sigma factor FlgM [bacterium]